MKTVTVTSDNPLEKLIEEAGDEDVLVVRDGHAVALITPFDDDDLYWYSREKSPEFIASIERARKQVAAEQTISHDELKRSLGI